MLAHVPSMAARRAGVPSPSKVKGVPTVYGTVAKFKIRPGAEAELMALAEDYASTTVPGYIGEYVYRLDGEPDTYIMAVMFDDRASYESNAASPAQHDRYLRFRALLADDPQWQDGEIISAPR